ncbi:MAG: hypothetical protein AAFX06_27565 [Planctomycetota bacterium]
MAGVLIRVQWLRRFCTDRLLSIVLQKRVARFVMEYIGEIHAPHGTPLLELSMWMHYIEAAQDLHPSAVRSGRNPVNGAPIVLRPPANAVRYVVDGQEIGGFSWGPSDQHHIQIAHVEGFRAPVLDRAQRIAVALGCEVELWEC